MQEMIALIASAGDAVALPLAIISALFAVFQWNKSQIWKRKEFAYQHFEKLQNDIAFRLATGMIDWERNFRLDQQSREVGQFFRSTNSALIHALRIHGRSDQKFSDEESVVRDIFDSFLGHFEMTCDMINSGLIKYSDVQPYLSYWIGFFTKTNPATAWRNDVADAITAFASEYGYTCVEKLKMHSMSKTRH